MIGQRIGHFELVSQLGRGGMGEVYLGVHEQIGTQVAVKMLLPQVSVNTGQVERFFNEARAAAKIQHAGIGKIFDVGVHEGRAYLVMELLQGETLATRIRRVGKLPLTQIGDIGKQICGVLDAVHAAGITHRDLKPDNIFLVPDRELGERVKILDFGIAKLSDLEGGLTATGGGSMGTPGYMSPAQWKNSKAVDWRTDAYSLGCLTFEMIAGRLPFLAQSVGEACAMHLTEEPPRLSALVVVPPALDALVAQLLAKAPDQRPASMRDIAEVFANVAPGPAATALAATLQAAPPVAPGAVTQASQPPLPATQLGEYQPRPSQIPEMPQPTTVGGARAEAAPRRRGLIVGLFGVVAALVVVIVVLIARDRGSPPAVGSSGAATGPGSGAAGSSVAAGAGSVASNTAGASVAISGPGMAGSATGAGSEAGPHPAAEAGSNANVDTMTDARANKEAGRAGSTPSRRRPKPRQVPQVEPAEPEVDPATLPLHTPKVRETVRTIYRQLDRCAAKHDATGVHLDYLLVIDADGRFVSAELQQYQSNDPLSEPLKKCLSAEFAKLRYGRSQNGTRNRDGYNLGFVTRQSPS